MKTTQERNGTGNKFSGFQLVLLVLSVYVLGAVFAETVFAIPVEIARVMKTLDTVICLVFLSDFFLRLFQAENKLVFLKWGWIDLISSIPYVDSLRVGRLFSILRLIRVLRALRSAKLIVEMLLKNRAQGTLTSVVLLTLVLVLFSSTVIINCERHANEANIKTGGDAIWWAITTITTVGYGDRYPITTEGRIMGVILMIAGIALVTTFTGFIATYFMQAEHQTEKDEKDKNLDLLIQEVRALREKIELLERKLSR